MVSTLLVTDFLIFVKGIIVLSWLFIHAKFRVHIADIFLEKKKRKKRVNEELSSKCGP